jgi:chromosomal replication initiation ATPase DnaA
MLDAELSIHREIIKTPRQLVLEALGEIARQQGVRPEQLFVRSISPRICRPRYAAMAFLKEQGWSGPKIARLFGMDPTSVCHGVRRHRELSQ